MTEEWVKIRDAITEGRLVVMSTPQPGLWYSDLVYGEGRLRMEMRYSPPPVFEMYPVVLEPASAFTHDEAEAAKRHGSQLYLDMAQQAEIERVEAIERRWREADERERLEMGPMLGYRRDSDIVGEHLSEWRQRASRDPYAPAYHPTLPGESVGDWAARCGFPARAFKNIRTAIEWLFDKMGGGRA